MSTAGRDERRSSERGRTHLPDVRGWYRGRMPDIRPGDFELNWTLLRREGNMHLDRLIEGGTWDDTQSVMTGTLSVRRPDAEAPRKLPLGRGHHVRLRVRWGSGFREVWRMRVSSVRVDAVRGTVECELEDPLDLLKRNDRDWMQFRKTKKRRTGFFLRDIVRRVAKVEGVRVGQVYRGRKRIFLKAMKGKSALEVLREACKKVKEAEKVRLVIRLRVGRLEVVAFERNRVLYQFGSKIEEALTEEEWVSERPATVIRAKGRIGKGKGAKKVRHTAFRRDVVHRFGRVEKEKNYGRVRSHADLKDKAERDLAKELRVKRTATLTTRGIPFLRRGEGCRWVTREPGWYGRAAHSRDRSFVYVTGVTHQVSGANYSMEVAVRQEDPFERDRKRRERELKKAARERRKKKRKS